jgi:ABC-type bacteriocin/lantibiotic exporter with double-glycine peptidase domain
MAQELKALKAEATVIIITHTPETFEDPDQIVDFFWSA